MCESSDQRSLIILRPAAVFGPGNRGNIFSLISQISRGKFVMVGSGANKKSMCYVENISAYICKCTTERKQSCLVNYTDSPDISMREFCNIVTTISGSKLFLPFRIPSSIGILAGFLFDIISKLTGKKFTLSKIRVVKFIGESTYGSAISETDFVRPYSIQDGLKSTIEAEILDKK